jgi:YHS domain-containing protein
MVLVSVLAWACSNPAAEPAQPVPAPAIAATSIEAAAVPAVPDAGHEACAHEHGAEHVVAATVLPAFKDAQGRLACPVMGDVVASPEESSGYVDYEGVRYYFCCSSCQTQFESAPEAFANGAFLRQEGIWRDGISDQG